VSAPRVILHADMDAFYASIEQRDHPELRGQPVIVGGTGRRGVVMTASYEARRFGVHSAMPGAIAHRLCPRGIFVTPRMDVYASVAAQVREVFLRKTPLVEPLSLDEAFLDVTASSLACGTGEEIARQIKAEIAAATGLTVSVGVASCKFVAKVASDLRKPDGLVVVPPGEEERFLAPLPVRRLWGAGPVTQAKFAALGWHHIGDLQRLSLEELSVAFGAATGAHFFALARGRDSRPVVPDREAKSVSNEVTFEHDRTARADCHAVLLQLSESVGRRLRRDGTRGHVVRIKVRFPPFVTHTRQRKLPAATHDDLLIFGAARELFDRLVPDPRPVRLLGVGVAHLVTPGQTMQGTLFEAGATPPRVLQAIDAIRDRFGDDAIRHGR
jgi:DNA polymerase-4